MTIMLKNQEKRKHIFVFMTTNYEDDVFEAIYRQLQTYQFAVSICGLTTETVHGCYGATQQPHFSLSTLRKVVSYQSQPIPDAVILSGGVQCINQLFADPRLHDFLEWCVATDIPVGICQPMPYELVISSKLFQTERILLQNGESHIQFVERFIEKIA